MNSNHSSPIKETIKDKEVNNGQDASYSLQYNIHNQLIKQPSPQESIELEINQHKLQAKNQQISPSSIIQNQKTQQFQERASSSNIGYEIQSDKVQQQSQIIRNKSKTSKNYQQVHEQKQKGEVSRSQIIFNRSQLNANNQETSKIGNQRNDLINVSNSSHNKSKSSLVNNNKCPSKNQKYNSEKCQNSNIRYQISNNIINMEQGSQLKNNNNILQNKTQDKLVQLNLKENNGTLKSKHDEYDHIKIITPFLHCPRHLNSNQVQHLWICLEKDCHSLITNSSQSSNKLKSNRQKSISSKSRSKSNQNTSDHKTRQYTKMQSRILCSQCINEQTHIGHRICTLKKFQQIVSSYHWASIQASKTVLSKIYQLKHNLEHFLNILSKKSVEVMTLGLTNSFNDPKGHHNKIGQIHHDYLNKYSQNNNKESRQYLNVQNQHNYHIQQYEYLLSKTEKIPIYHHHISTPTNKPNTNLNNMFSNSSLQLWQQIIQNSKGGLSALPSINKILSFKQESISEQIQDIYESFQNNINDSIANLQFINQFKDWVYNPDDMHADQVGLTLDRNKLQAVTLSNQETKNRSEKSQTQSIQILNNDQSYNVKKIKAAFLQTQLKSQQSRSFRLEKLKQKIMIGCTDHSSHYEISTALNYQNFEHLVYGISIDADGKVIIHKKGLTQKLIPNIQIKVKDIIQITYHRKQSTLAIIKYSLREQINSEQSQDKSNLQCLYMSLIGNVDRTIIETMSIQQAEEDTLYLFGAVSGDGDCISIAENINLQYKNINNLANSARSQIQIAQQVRKNQINKQSVQCNPRITKFKQAQSKKNKQIKQRIELTNRKI